MRSGTRRVAIIGLGAMGQVVLVGIGFEKTTVRLFADPAIKQNMHEVEVAGGRSARLVSVFATTRCRCCMKFSVAKTSRGNAFGHG